MNVNDQWWVSKGGSDPAGPFSTAQLLQQWNAHEISASDLVAQEGWSTWQPARDLMPLAESAVVPRESRAAPAPDVSTWTIFGGRKYWCSHCHVLAVPMFRARGTFAGEIGVWVLALIGIPFTFGLSLLVGLLYSLWRVVAKDRICPSCRLPGVVPGNSPRAQADMRSVTHFL
jgi:hypothetical protein